MEIVITDHTYGAVAMGAEGLVRRCDGAIRIARSVSVCRCALCDGSALPQLLATTPDEAADLRHYLAVTARVEIGITSWRGQGFLRLSTHVYNTAEDYEDFAERVVPLIAELGRRARSGEEPSRR